MNYSFKILPNSELESIVPLVFDLNQGKVDKSVLSSRFNEMKNQYYTKEGAVAYTKARGLLTRHNHNKYS